MTTWIYLLLNVITTMLKLLRPGGAKALASENLILKQQLLVMKKKAKTLPKVKCIRAGYLWRFSIYY